MKDIGAVLKNARENKEFTQKQVMELTGINKKSLSGYENNVAEPDLQTFATLINLYGLSADEVLELLFLLFYFQKKKVLFFLYSTNLIFNIRKKHYYYYGLYQNTLHKNKEKKQSIRSFQIVWTVFSFLFRSKCGHRIALGCLPGRDQSAK